MSEAVSALGGAVFDGYVRVEEAGLRGMITLKGDLASTALKGAATGVAGVDFPAQGEANCAGERGILWMAPDEVLVLCPYDEAAEAAAANRRALAGEHVLVANVSDARALFRISGPACREVIAKLTPADVSPAGFPPGRLRRTRLAQAAAAVWMPDPGTVEVICFRSVAAYVFEILTLSATPGGEVGHF